jgi:hypothetical protein
MTDYDGEERQQEQSDFSFFFFGVELIKSDDEKEEGHGICE